MTYANLYNPAHTLQTQSIHGEKQVKNNAGGFVYLLDKWKRLDRFLILGSDAPTYYQKAPDLTRENAACVLECYADDPVRTVDTIVEVSTAGRAPKNDPAIFALALGSVSDSTKARQLALIAMYKVCRTGTHLFQFVANARGLGKGWGRGMKRAVADWYDKKAVDKVAYQAIKYRSRENYTHERLLDTAHPKGDGSPERNALYSWIVGKDVNLESVPAIVRGHVQAMKMEKAKELIPLIEAHKLPWEALPTWALTDADVWKSMLPDMGLTALVRNLGNMTRLEAIKPLSDEESLVVERLGNEDALKEARLHPFQILMAHAVYGSGHGARGSGEWKPSRRIVDALDDAFYKSFKFVEPSGKRTLIGLDVSGSMSSPIMGSPLAVCEAAAAMAMVTVRTEKNWHVMAFDQGIRELPISARMSLNGVLKHTRDINGGGTDCALPMLYASANKLQVDTFMVITDNETWAGRMHPSQALRQYRKDTGINAKLVVIGMTSTGFTIADPNDDGMLDVVGFDTNAPSVIADFARG